MDMGQNPVPPVNIPIPIKKNTKMGAPTPKWDRIGFDPQLHVKRRPLHASAAEQGPNLASVVASLPPRAWETRPLKAPLVWGLKLGLSFTGFAKST